MTDSGAEYESANLRGEIVEPGRARLEDPENPDAWLEAEYRDGWVQRKLMNTDQDEYAKMVHPFQQQCILCKEWQDCEMWGVDSPYCPRCEQYMDYAFPRLMAWVCDGESLEREGVEI